MIYTSSTGYRQGFEIIGFKNFTSEIYRSPLSRRLLFQSRLNLHVTHCEMYLHLRK